MIRSDSRAQSSLARRSRVFWLSSWFLVIFYLVASGRAFIPGICATQRALEAQCVETSGAPTMHALRACCVLPPAPSKEGKGGSHQPVTPDESGCALCKIVTTMAPLVATVVLPDPPRPEYNSPQALAHQRAESLAHGALQTRAPPALAHA